MSAVSAPLVIKKPDPSKIYVVIMSHVNDLGTWREGSRLRGSHPAVKFSPECFVEDGHTADEIHAAVLARFYRVDEKES